MHGPTCIVWANLTPSLAQGPGVHLPRHRPGLLPARRRALRDARPLRPPRALCRRRHGPRVLAHLLEALAERQLCPGAGLLRLVRRNLAPPAGTEERRPATRRPRRRLSNSMPRGRFSIGGIKDLRAFFIRMSTLVRDDEVRRNAQWCHNYRRRHYIVYSRDNITLCTAAYSRARLVRCRQ
jgi:hypothetical protein